MALWMFCGLQGSGKTYGMLKAVLERFKRKPCNVYTNIESVKIPEAIYFCDVEQMVDFADGLILLDEVGIVMPSQFWHEVGRDLLVRICQMRHDGLDLYYTVQRREGANVNLREQTGRFITCARVGPWIWQRFDNGGKKLAGGSKFIRLEQSIFDLYNTHTNIDKNGNSSERKVSRLISRAVAREAEKREKQRLARRPERERSLLVYDQYERGWFGGPLITRQRPDALAAYKWLKDNGYLMADCYEHWTVQVRRELKRRAWLAKFSLGPDDAPVTCTEDNPWMDGYDPESVKKRWAEEKERRRIELEIRIEASKQEKLVFKKLAKQQGATID